MDTVITNNYGNGSVLDLNHSNGITLEEPDLEQMRVDRLERTRALMKVNMVGSLKGDFYLSNWRLVFWLLITSIPLGHRPILSTYPALPCNRSYISRLVFNFFLQFSFHDPSNDGFLKKMNDKNVRGSLYFLKK